MAHVEQRLDLKLTEENIGSQPKVTCLRYQYYGENDRDISGMHCI